MIHEIDVDEILAELQALAEETTGAATVAVLACMDVVERHGRIAAETEIGVRLQVDPAPSIMVQHPVEVRVLQYGDPEPDRDTRWVDAQGDEWSCGDNGNWETPETTCLPWDNLHRTWFPMIEVTP